MPTPQQERIYNDIIYYYTLAEKMIGILEKYQESDPKSEATLDVVEELVSTLESQAEKLGSCYLEYVKSNNSAGVAEKTRDLLNAIIAKIEECRIKITDINS